MQVAFDEQIFAVQHYGGISRLFAELLRQFSDDPGIGVDVEPIGAPIVNRYLLDNPELTRRLALRPAANSYAALARYFTRPRPRRHADVVHNTFYFPHGLAGFPGARRVVTVHDMIPERMPATRRRLDFVTLKRRYVERADHIICVSEATREDMLALYGDVKAGISVVHHGVDAIFQPDVPRWADLPERYVLFVGNRSQYKDADVLLRAFAQVARTDPDLQLLFVGGGALTKGELATIDALGVRNRVAQRALPDAEMAAAYGQAVMCVFPSRYEGFGLPALESMACGTPTVLAAATSLPEVGGDAALYFPPGDSTALAGVMRDLLGDDGERARRREAGLARAGAFSWHRCAVETAAAYEAALQ